MCEDTPIRARNLILPSLLLFVQGANLGGWVIYTWLYMCDATMGCVDTLCCALDFITTSLRWYVCNNHRVTACYTSLVGVMQLQVVMLH